MIHFIQYNSLQIAAKNKFWNYIHFINIYSKHTHVRITVAKTFYMIFVSTKIDQICTQMSQLENGNLLARSL